MAHKQIKTTLCPKCKTGKVMTGRHQPFNAKDDGKIVCNDCKVAAIYATILENNNAANS